MIFGRASLPLSLETAPCGRPLRVLQVAPECPDFCRLRELGFAPASCIRKLTHNGALVCLIQNTRVALDPKLGRHILVEAA